jgi:predicted signal transduction protein with EAL and GGDEF domain
MFIDLDKFKQVNDTLGHDAGDELLRMASLRILEEGLQRTPETIDSCMTAFGDLCDRPPKDIVFVRFAGDEFVALLPGMTDRSSLSTVADRIITSLQRPFRIGGTDVQIGASIGITVTPQDTRDAAELLNFADLAMYSAKEAGRGRFAFFDGVLRETVIQRVNIERELREAVEKDELVVHFQPKIRVAGQSVAGAEALVRWQHPGRGLLMPKDFIAIAEQSGLIGELGCRVAELAMAQAARWRNSGRPTLVSINVSRLQFQRQGFVDKFASMLKASGASASDIELEITESVALGDLSHTKSSLERLRAFGVRIAIDDFGCGFSNLSQLTQIPFDTLKIDRSLVEGIGTDNRAESIIRAVVSMGHSLGHEIVAEGVETMRQLTFLKSLNCDVVQGFLFSRALDGAAFEAWSDDRGRPPAVSQQQDMIRRLAAQ